MAPFAVMHDQEAEQREALRQPLARQVARWSEGGRQFNTAIANLTFYRREAPTQPDVCLVAPSVALVIQGAKLALLGEESYRYDVHRFLITSLDLPARMQIIEASAAQPYLGLALRLDLGVIAELIAQGGLPPPRERTTGPGMVLGETTVPLLDAFRRLLALLDDPDTIPVLAPLIQREICYRLLVSDQGARLRHIATVGSHSHRISQAITWLKSHFVQPLRIEELAASVQMSASSFHHHFRQLTAMSPLQFQKWLRLNEARRLMLAEDVDASTAAYQVGYESPSQFSREYSRLFGAPPRRDIELFRQQLPGRVDELNLQSRAA